MENLLERNKFLETYNLLRLNHDEIENLNRSIISKEFESIVKNFPANKSSGPDDFTGELYQTFKEELIPILLKIFLNRRRGTLSNTFYEVSITLMPKPDKDATEKEKITG